MNEMRETIATLLKKIEPFDEREREHQDDALEWIRSGAEIFRIAKPDTPPKHLISYFVVLDPKNRAILLVDHIKAEKWLPPGGHVEVGENPITTVERESIEELGITTEFLFDHPVFVSQVTTVGKTAGHRDVCLWYVIRGAIDNPITYEEREFYGVRWFTFDEVLATDIALLDEHLHRFVSKLKTRFGESDIVSNK
jgi:8-oxo-dGTP diphosphatase